MICSQEMASSLPSGADLIVEVAEPDAFVAVRALIVDNLTKRWKRYEPLFNPDLEDFHGFFGSSLVIVARMSERIVGCGVLVRESETIGRIVRMSVTSELQRRGVGSMILRSLLEHASMAGYKEIVLETTAVWESAVAFYQRRGFLPTKMQDGDQHFRFVLTKI